MVVFDTSFLAIAFDEHASVPADPTTGAPLVKCRERIDLLIKNLGINKTRILIPTPVIAEFMVYGGRDKNKRLELITNSKSFSIASFDIRAAIECALIEEEDYRSKRNEPSDETKAKVKFDRQIIAVAIARGAKGIFTGDKKLAHKARQCGLIATLTWELELPLEPEAAKPSPQTTFPFHEGDTAVQ